MAGAQPGAGGGKMLRAVVGAAGGGATESIPPATAAPRWPTRAATPPRVISLPPSSSNHQSSLQSSIPAGDGVLMQQPVSSLPALPQQEWEHGGSPVEHEGMGDDDFWVSPTKEEVLRAISTMQRMFVPIAMQKVSNDGTSSRVGNYVIADTSSTPSNVKVSAPESLPVNTDNGLSLSDKTMNHSRGVIDAFHSLRVNPSIKKMVASLSTDTAVWNAVMKNDAVKEVKKSFFAVESAKAKPGDTPDIVGTVVGWILDCTKTMMLTFLDKIWTIAKEVLQLNHTPEVGKKIEVFEETVRSSFMISVVVFIVVILFRVYQG